MGGNLKNCQHTFGEHSCILFPHNTAFITLFFKLYNDKGNKPQKIQMLPNVNGGCSRRRVKRWWGMWVAGQCCQGNGRENSMGHVP